ncbi:hypothetical protein HID58_054804 [Brassica napus]|uniref:BnaC03g48790D protein n=3 Tax=Brassica TaxID=3705 RepID=A0A078FJJ4_BRANA|nr:hypothetical protein HID58_054804 [Brassica napus]CAF1706897.1 unnamed protein product [Brassica napus]CDY14580.1 BnaC03g48790D [Brassica napus]VDC94962.1 unnamed protein product [Brassica oleracea]
MSERGLYKNGENERGVWVFKNLIRSGYYHDEIAWKIVIDGVGKQEQVEAKSVLFFWFSLNVKRIGAATKSKYY